MKSHKLTQEQALELVPDSKKAKTRQDNRAKAVPKPRWKCPVDDCESKGTFDNGNSNRRRHLERVHKWTTERAVEYIPLSALERRNAIDQAARTVAAAQEKEKGGGEGEDEEGE